MIHSPATMTPRNKNLILNWIFIPGLLLLALNDHYLKNHYPNWLTGKLSDFTGLLIFPMFLAFLFPQQAKSPSSELRSSLLLGRNLRSARLSLITGLFFIFWKSPSSTQLIAFYNRFAPIR